MRTEMEIREELETAKTILETVKKLGQRDLGLTGFYKALEWVLEEQ